MSTTNLNLPSQNLGTDLDSSSWNLLLNESRCEGGKDTFDDKFQSPDTSAFESPSFGPAKALIEQRDTPNFHLDQTSSPTGNGGNA